MRGHTDRRTLAKRLIAYDSGPLHRRERGRAMNKGRTRDGRNFADSDNFRSKVRPRFRYISLQAVLSDRGGFACIVYRLGVGELTAMKFSHGVLARSKIDT